MIIKRKLKTLENKTGQKIKSWINQIIDTHERYKKSYFWTNTGSASSRRREEFDNKYEFTLGDVKYEIFQTLSISCRNFYFSTDIRRNGKKSNIKVLKNLINY